MSLLPVQIDNQNWLAKLILSQAKPRVNASYSIKMITLSKRSEDDNGALTEMSVGVGEQRSVAIREQRRALRVSRPHVGVGVGVGVAAARAHELPHGGCSEAVAGSTQPAWRASLALRPWSTTYTSRIVNKYILNYIYFPTHTYTYISYLTLP